MPRSARLLLLFLILWGMSGVSVMILLSLLLNITTAVDMNSRAVRAAVR